MSGYNTILKVRQLEKECDELGFMMCHPRHYNSGDWGQLIAIKPKDSDSLPIYNRDAELFIGTLEQLEVWMRGIEWARQYDEMLKLSNTKKRERKEQDQRNRNLIEILKQEARVKVDK